MMTGVIAAGRRRPRPGGGGPTGDLAIAVQDFATIAGSNDYTTSALTGITPKAALIFANTNAVSNEPGATVTAQLSVTAVISGDGWNMTTASRDGTASTSTRRVQWQASPIIRTLTTAVGPWLHQGPASLISGGINVNFSTHGSSGRMVYVAFAGDDVSADVGMNPIGASTVTPNPGLSADVVFVFGINYGSDNSVNSHGSYTIGIALNDGSQRCAFYAETNGLADSAPFQAILTNRVAAQVDSATGALSYDITAGNFTATTFHLAPSATASSDDFMWLALNLGGAQANLVDFTTPTSTGSATITGAGFTPRFALVVITNLEATDPTFPLSTDSTMSSLSICSVGDEQWAVALGIESGAATMDTASKVDGTAILTIDGSGTTLLEATLTAFTSDGMTLNYSTVQGAGKKGFILFIE